MVRTMKLITPDLQPGENWIRVTDNYILCMCILTLCAYIFCISIGERVNYLPSVSILHGSP